MPHRAASLVAVSSSVPVVVDPLVAPIALLRATSRGLAYAGLPLRVALAAVLEEYGYEPTSLVVEDAHTGLILVNVEREETVQAISPARAELE